MENEISIWLNCYFSIGSHRRSLRCFSVHLMSFKLLQSDNKSLWQEVNACLCVFPEYPGRERGLDRRERENTKVPSDRRRIHQNRWVMAAQVKLPHRLLKCPEAKHLNELLGDGQSVTDQVLESSDLHPLIKYQSHRVWNQFIYFELVNLNITVKHRAVRQCRLFYVLYK